MTICLARSAGFRNAVAAQRKRHVEGCREESGWIAIDGVGSDAQPIRLQSLIPNPCLQIGGTGRKWRPRCYRPGRRQEQQIATVHLNLRTEKVVIRRQEKWCV